MFKKILFSLTVFISFATFSDRAESFPPVTVLQSVHDGDTIKVIQETKTFYVRFSDIDAPEIKQDFGPESRDHLKTLLTNKFLTLKIATTDKYGRTVARVFADKVDVNATMVKDGYAWFYGTYSKDKSVQALETEARKNYRGLWIKPNPVPPWEFRKAAKKTVKPNQPPEK